MLAYGANAVVVDCTLSQRCAEDQKCENDDDCYGHLWCNMRGKPKTCTKQQGRLKGCDRDRQCWGGSKRNDAGEIENAGGHGKCTLTISGKSICLPKYQVYCPGEYCSTPKGDFNPGDKQDCGGMCGGLGNCGVEGDSMDSYYGQECQAGNGKTYMCGTANEQSDKFGKKVNCDLKSKVQEMKIHHYIVKWRELINVNMILHVMVTR